MSLRTAHPGVFVTSLTPIAGGRLSDDRFPRTLPTKVDYRFRGGMPMRKGVLIVMGVVVVLGFAGGALVAAPGQSTFEKLASIRAELVTVKGELGMYSCCINPSCNFCALATGMCPCGDGAKSGDGVCGECLLGWRAGYGNIAGVNADDVSPLGDDMLEMMYEARAAAMPDGAADAGSSSVHRHAGH